MTARPTSLSARRLNRATLARQLLLERAPLTVVETVHRIGAVQAQEPASPYLALWNRVAGFEAAALDRAFTAGSIVKGTLMRITLHAVDATDYSVFHEAMQPTLRAARLGDRRFQRTGLSGADADALIPDVLGFTATPRTNAEAEAWLDARLGVTPKPGIWWALRQYGPFLHAPTGGPWSFGPRPSYAGAPDQLRAGAPTPVEAMPGLIRRYLEAFGPASAGDIAQFGMLNAPLVRAALAPLAGELVTFLGPDGTQLLDVPAGLLPEEDASAPPRLLGMWDSVLLGHRDRSRIIPPAYRRRIVQSNGDTLPTLLVDGSVAGVWRPVDGGIEASAFHALPDDAWAGLETEARALLAFLAPREPLVYRRYARWWDGLAAHEVRVIGG
ncbi:MAG: winged helix DNA-binding domain-containing protein [Chloroflexota bacterium]